MLIKYKALECGRRRLGEDDDALATYEKAVAYFGEKREILERLSQINRELRKLQTLDADIVAEALADVPFRKSPGRTKKATAP